MVSMEYDLEIDQVIEKIKKEKAQTVCIQLPEGMRPLAGKIRDELHQKEAKMAAFLRNALFILGPLFEGMTLGVNRSALPQKFVRWRGFFVHNPILPF